jgi:PiT family inorganic phosphate transporter
LGISLSPAQQLFFLGGVAIAVGVFTYSRRVMMTVGTGIFQLNPVAAAVVVWSHSAVLFIFSSQTLESWLQAYNLPTIPLVPVSSSQAIVGAVIGIGLLKGGKGIHWKTVAGITSSWVTTPIIALLICFVSLFFLQNVFQQKTFKPVEYSLTQAAIDRLAGLGLPYEQLKPIMWETYPNSMKFTKAVSGVATLNKEELQKARETAELFEVEISADIHEKLDTSRLSDAQNQTLVKLDGRTFQHKWQIRDALAELSVEFKFKPDDKKWNTHLNEIFQYLYNQLEK